MNPQTLAHVLEYVDVVAELTVEENKAAPCSGLVAVLKLQRQWVREKLARRGDAEPTIGA
jgi:hypothetical protein